MKMLIMDCPRGHVCRILGDGEWIRHPSAAGNLKARITEILQAVWHARVTMEQTMAMIENDNQPRPLSFVRRAKTLIPSFFTVPASEAAGRKQKVPE